MSSRTGVGRRSSVTLAGLLALGLLAACAEEGAEGSGGGGAGVAVGASMEEYHQAFEDVEPITLVTQTSGPSGSSSSKYIESYVAAVEEWSDGKITFDVTFSAGIAGPDEFVTALNDGRLDLGITAPTFEPQRFPVSNALISFTAVGLNTPVGGTLARQGLLNEVGMSSDAIRKEYEDNDLHMLVPAASYGASMLGCTEENESVTDFKGGTTAVSSQGGGVQAEALGLTPASVPYTEQFEALQRGVIECSMTQFTSAALTGIVPEAKHVYVDPAQGYVGAAGGLAVSKPVWDDLPLVAQQLLFDRLDASFIGINESSFETIAQVDEQARAAGGAIEPLPADAAESLASGTDKVVAAIADDVPGGAELTEEALAAAEKWKGIVEGLGLDQDVAYDGFSDWYTDGKVDQSAWVEQLFSEAMSAHRPE